MPRVRVPVPVAVVFEVIGMRAAVPSAAATTTAAATLTGAAPSKAGQGAGDGLGGVVLCGAHEFILHAT